MAENWINFADQLPRPADALDGKHIEAMDTTGKRRVILWDWIPAAHPQAKALWLNNRFSAWRHIRKDDQ